MSEAPERIWINGAMAMEVSGKGWPEYVRVDLYEQRGERIAELQAEVERTKASAICYVSHNIHWLGEKGALGWCLGCGKHRSLIRETQPPQEQSNEN